MANLIDKFFAEFEPADFVALLILTYLFIFKMTGHNGAFDLPASIIVGYYFGKRITIKEESNA